MARRRRCGRKGREGQIGKEGEDGGKSEEKARGKGEEVKGEREIEETTRQGICSGKGGRECIGGEGGDNFSPQSERFYV